ncbi:MAG TPA: FlgD immunoglobulin-like domain containing protein [Bacteroidota bacterium]|nr:FlgD immunoglobulin-like domain containing protein [Bacteroidota bacterium]
MKKTLVLCCVLLSSFFSSRGQTSFWQLMPNTPPNAGFFFDLYVDQRGDAYLSFDPIGPYRSTNYGASWTSIATGLPQNDVSSFTSPVVDMVLAGLYSGQFSPGGVYRTTNGGANWTATSLNNRGIEQVVSFTGQTVFARDGLVLFRSTNSGATWDSVYGSSPGGGGIRAVTTNRPTNSIFLADFARGVIRSTNNGLTWFNSNSGLADSTAVGALAVDSVGAVYAGITFPSNFPGRVYRSTNNGSTWSVVGSMPFPPQRLLTNASGHLFGLAVEHGVVRSTDGGRSWASLNAAFADSSQVWGATVSPGGFVYLGTGIGRLYRSVQPTALPGVATLLLPGNGTIQTAQNIQFNWTRYEDGLLHHLQVADSPTFTQTSLVLNDSTLTTSAPNISTLPRGRLLYWRVRVRNVLGWGNFSSPFSFATSPDAPTLLSPPDSAVNQPTTLTLSWSSLGTGLTYHVQVATDPNFTNLVVNDSTVTTTQRQVGPLASSTTYFWRVRVASSPGGPSPFSPPRRFTTVGVPNILLVPPSISFRTVQLGSRINASLRAINTGTANLRVDSVRIGGRDAQDFAIVGSTGPFPPVPPQDTLHLVVQSAPQDTGSKVAVLVLYSNAASSPDTVPMSALVIPSSVQVKIDRPVAGDSLRMTVNVQQAFRPVLSEIYYRNGGQRRYQRDTLQPRGDTLTFAFPPAVVNIRGIEYYLELVDSANNILTFADSTNPARIRVIVPSFRSPLLLSASQYRMISVPLEVIRPGFGDVLEDDLGAYDPTQWRLFRWQANAYAEFQQISPPSFQPGNALWLITRTGGTFDVDSAVSMISGQPFTIVLQPGWNQIANPFAYLVNWLDIGNNQLVRGPVGFDGRQYVPNISLLQPWEGYFVLNDSTQPISLVVPPTEFDQGIQMSKLPNVGMPLYRLKISARAGGLSDEYNYVGFNTRAQVGDDRLDIPEPPQIQENIQLSISENSRSYACSYKPLHGEGQEWRLTLSSPLSNQIVSVSLHEEGELPPAFQIIIIDEDNGTVIPLENGRFAVETRRAHENRALRLIIGTETYAEQVRSGMSVAPTEYALYQNYPNPFNPTTTIRYALKRRGDVRLEIFNLLGQRVRTLVHREQNAGVYSVVWDGTDEAAHPMASGVYVARLDAGEFVAVRKMLLLR